MLIWFTYEATGNQVAINTAYVVVDIRGTETPVKDKTVISMVNGALTVQQSELEVVGMLNAASKE